ncbi:MAG: hypothetical protein HY922_16410 [Elusimicrobia bacterium]|nr:hypothetical protein [Elusimicrobiota bacterium]
MRLMQNHIVEAVSDAKEALRLAPEEDLVRNTVPRLIPFAAPLGVDLRLPEVTAKGKSVPRAQQSDSSKSAHHFGIIAGVLGGLFAIAIAMIALLARKRSDLKENSFLDDSGMRSIGPRTKTGLIFAIPIVIGIAVAGIWYWNYTRSPQYSLWVTVKAIKQHDITTFEKYADVDGLISRFMDQIMEQTTRNADQATSVWGQIGAALAKGFVGMIKPRMVENAKEQIERYIENGEFENAEKASQGQPPSIPIREVYGNIAGGKNGFKGVQYVKKEGKIAYVGLGFYREDYDKTLVLDLKMRDKGDYRQIAEISNFPDLMKQVNELEAESIIHQIRGWESVVGHKHGRFAETDTVWENSNHLMATERQHD